MANVVSNSVDILSQAALDGFTSVMQPINTFSTNFSPAPGQLGDGVQVNLYGSATTANNFGGDYTANSDSTVGVVTVNMNNHVYKTVHVTDTERANQGVDLYKLGYFAGQSVAKSVFTGCMSVLTTGTYGVPLQTLGSATNFSTSGVLAARTAAAAWGPDKNVIMDSAYYSALLANLPSNTTIQDNSIREGSVGRIYGFNAYETDVAPMVQSNSSTKAIFAHPSAVAIASRYLQPDDGGTYIDARAVTDDKTKATLGTRTWYDPSKGKKFFTVEWLGGYSAGVTGAAKIIYGG
jgi:hypothetical protein